MIYDGSNPVAMYRGSGRTIAVKFFDVSESGYYLGESLTNQTIVASYFDEDDAPQQWAISGKFSYIGDGYFSITISSEESDIDTDSGVILVFADEIQSPYQIDLEFNNLSLESFFPIPRGGIVPLDEFCEVSLSGSNNFGSPEEDRYQ
jgi:hypothetical protein